MDETYKYLTLENDWLQMGLLPELLDELPNRSAQGGGRITSLAALEEIMGRNPFLTSFFAIYSLFYATYPLVGSYCGTFAPSFFVLSATR
jgi:hypothetical protein